MLTLNLSAYEMQQLEQASQQAGMSVNQYAISRLFPQPPKTAPTLYDMAMAYEGADVSEIELDNPMIALAKSLPKPTSYTKNAVELQREWRSEWD